MPRIGTHGLVGLPRLAYSLCIGTTGSPVPCNSLSQVHATYQPDAVWAGLQDSAQTYPGVNTAPGSDIIDSVSTSHRWFAFARLPGPHLTGSSPAFSATLTTIALYDSSSRWFGAGLLIADAEGPTLISYTVPHLPPSLLVCSGHTMLSELFVRDHRQKARAGPASGYAMEGRRALADLLAVPATELLTDSLHYLPLPRHAFQRPCHVLAQLAQAIAPATGAHGRWVNHNPLTGQILGEGLALGALARKALDADGFGHSVFGGKLIFRRGGLGLFEAQGELIDP